MSDISPDDPRLSAFRRFIESNLPSLPLPDLNARQIQDFVIPGDEATIKRQGKIASIIERVMLEQNDTDIESFLDDDDKVIAFTMVQMIAPILREHHAKLGQNLPIEVWRQLILWIAAVGWLVRDDYDNGELDYGGF